MRAGDEVGGVEASLVFAECRGHDMLAVDQRRRRVVPGPVTELEWKHGAGRVQHIAHALGAGMPAATSGQKETSGEQAAVRQGEDGLDRKSTRLNSSH